MRHKPYHSIATSDSPEYYFSFWITKISEEASLSTEIAAILLKSVENNTSFYDLCNQNLGWSTTKTMRFVKEKFRDKKSGSSLRTYVCSRYNNKYCVICSKIRPTEDFTGNSARPDGLQQRCIYCDSSYRKDNAELYKHHAALRRSAGKQLISLNYKQQILDFYKHCPAGYQVDHILPLNGKTVCGLHVPWNLQYLTAAANNKKKNKIIPE